MASVCIVTIPEMSLSYPRIRSARIYAGSDFAVSSPQRDLWCLPLPHSLLHLSHNFLPRHNSAVPRRAAKSHLNLRYYLVLLSPYVPYDEGNARRTTKAKRRRLRVVSRATKSKRWRWNAAR